MFDQSLIDKIDFHLIRVLHTVLTESSVSRAALRLDMHQPAVSAALKRLREITGDPILVRSGSGLVPTDMGLAIIEPCAAILRAAEELFVRPRRFDPATDSGTFRIACADYLGNLILPELMTWVKAKAPHCVTEFHPAADRSACYAKLASGELDAMLISWFAPTPGLHASALFEDELLCMVSQSHTSNREGWTVEAFLAAEHLVSTSPAERRAHGMIDAHLARLGLARKVVTYFSHFALIAQVVARTSMVMMAGRSYCERAVDQLPLVILPSPIEFPRMVFFQIWHERSHHSERAQWLRDQIQQVTADKYLP